MKRNRLAEGVQIGRALEAIDTARVSLACARQYLIGVAPDNKALSDAFNLVSKALGFTTAASQKAWEYPGKKAK